LVWKPFGDIIFLYTTVLKQNGCDKDTKDKTNQYRARNP